jgi:hypothetical protein
MSQLDLFSLISTTKEEVEAVVNDGDIRRALCEGEMFFSIVDTIRVLMGYTNQEEARKYWLNLKLKIAKDEPSFEVARSSRQLKLLAQDGKRLKAECLCLRDTLQTTINMCMEVFTKKEGALQVSL